MPFEGPALSLYHQYFFTLTTHRRPSTSYSDHSRMHTVYLLHLYDITRIAPNLPLSQPLTASPSLLDLPSYRSQVQPYTLSVHHVPADLRDDRHNSCHVLQPGPLPSTDPVSTALGYFRGPIRPPARHHHWPSEVLEDEAPLHRWAIHLPLVCLSTVLSSSTVNDSYFISYIPVSSYLQQCRSPK